MSSSRFYFGQQESSHLWRTQLQDKRWPIRSFVWWTQLISCKIQHNFSFIITIFFVLYRPQDTMSHIIYWYSSPFTITPFFRIVVRYWSNLQKTRTLPNSNFLTRQSSISLSMNLHQRWIYKLRFPPRTNFIYMLCYRNWMKRKASERVIQEIMITWDLCRWHFGLLSRGRMGNNFARSHYIITSFVPISRV